MKKKHDFAEPIIQPAALNRSGADIEKRSDLFNRALHAAHFFFQAEDGIRVGRVTGVQTCALPISGADIVLLDNMSPDEVAKCVSLARGRVLLEVSGGVKIGRASCRERG